MGGEEGGGKEGVGSGERGLESAEFYNNCNFLQCFLDSY